jgi:phosphatidylglycerophosphate synthase
MPPKSTLRKFQRHIAESKLIYRRSRSLRSSIYGFLAASLFALALFTLYLYFLSGPGIWLKVFLWTSAFIIAYTAFVFTNLPLLRDPGGIQRDRFGVANILTSLRLFAFPPVLVLLLEGRIVPASALYITAVITDMIDGYVARTFDQETVFGVMIDPVADILLTMALFLFLWLSGDIPLWLFIILCIRYTQFFVGLFFLVVRDSVPNLGATATGKVVGIVQALGIILLMIRWVTGVAWPTGMYRIAVYIILGAAFSSVIVSQTVIGWKALRGEK